MRSTVYVTSTLRVSASLALLAVVAACKGESITSRDPDAVFGTAKITVNSFGVNLDPDGYLIDVRGLEQHTVPASGAVVLRILAGPARLTLGGVAANCHVAGDTFRMVTVARGLAASERFVVTCGSGKQHLAFASLRNGNVDIFVQQEGTTDVTRITTSDWVDSDPVWSPSGNRIAYATLSPDSATSYIRVVSSTGDSLATIGSLNSHAGYPAWSPSLDKLAFVSNVSGNSELYVVNADGSGLQRLTNTPGTELRPAWSPDGTQLVYDLSVDDPLVSRDLFIINADGTGARQLVTGGNDNIHASWSPEGERIAFSSRRNGSGDIYITTLNGSSLLRVTGHGNEDGDPVWAADGKALIFTSQRSGIRSLYRYVIADGELQLLTDDNYEDYDASVSR
jgi:Tol biopolymer transport system component